MEKNKISTVVFGALSFNLSVFLFVFFCNHSVHRDTYIFRFLKRESITVVLLFEFVMMTIFLIYLLNLNSLPYCKNISFINLICSFEFHSKKLSYRQFISKCALFDQKLLFVFFSSSGIL